MAQRQELFEQKLESVNKDMEETKMLEESQAETSGVHAPLSAARRPGLRIVASSSTR